MPYKTRCKTGRTSVKVRAMKSCWNFSQQTTRSIPLDSNLMFRCVSYYLGAFGTVGCVTTLISKRAKLVQKFMPGSGIGIFCNERTRSTPLDPKLTFWCVSYYLGTFGTIWLPYETRGKTGRCSAKVCVTKSCRNFLQRTHPIHPIAPSTDVLVCFVLFVCIRDRLVALRNSAQNGPN